MRATRANVARIHLVEREAPPHVGGQRRELPLRDVGAGNLLAHLCNVGCGTHNETAARVTRGSGVVFVRARVCVLWEGGAWVYVWCREGDVHAGG